MSAEDHIPHPSTWTEEELLELVKAQSRFRGAMPRVVQAVCVSGSRDGKLLHDAGDYAVYEFSVTEGGMPDVDDEWWHGIGATEERPRFERIKRVHFRRHPSTLVPLCGARGRTSGVTGDERSVTCWRCRSVLRSRAKAGRTDLFGGPE